MSEMMNMAVAIKERLESVAALDGVGVLVEEVKDLDNAVLQTLEKSKGECILVRYLGGRNKHERASDVIIKEASFGVIVYTVPTLRNEEARSNMAINEAMQLALHGWRPDYSNHSPAILCQDKMKYISDDLIPDKNMLIHISNFTVPILLNDNK